MASFNLHAHLRYKTKRQDIANKLRRSLEVQVADFGGEFDGVPTITRRWWFFPEVELRGTNDIESLWQVFRCAKDFADNSNDDERKAAFETSFETALKIWGIRQPKLTTGLFWIRPDFYVSLDSNNLQYIPNHLPHLLASKAAQRDLSGTEYLELCTYIRDKLNEPSAPVDSIPKLSVEAWFESQRTPLKRLVTEVAQQETETGLFDPKNLADARKRQAASIVARQGQQEFRNKLLAAYEGQCTITGYDVEEALEAAHIHPYRGPDTNRIQNGLLLRADIHNLFDHGFIGVDPDTEPWKVRIREELRKTQYKDLAGKPVSLPTNSEHWPNAELLRMHWEKAYDGSW